MHFLEQNLITNEFNIFKFQLFRNNLKNCKFSEEKSIVVTISFILGFLVLRYTKEKGIDSARPPF